MKLFYKFIENSIYICIYVLRILKCSINTLKKENIKGILLFM